MDRSAKVAVCTMVSMVLIVSVSALWRRDGAPPEGSPSPFAAPTAAAEAPPIADPAPDATTADAR